MVNSIHQVALAQAKDSSLYEELSHPISSEWRGYDIWMDHTICTDAISEIASFLPTVKDLLALERCSTICQRAVDREWKELCSVYDGNALSWSDCDKDKQPIKWNAILTKCTKKIVKFIYSENNSFPNIDGHQDIELADKIKGRYSVLMSKFPLWGCFVESMVHHLRTGSPIGFFDNRQELIVHHADQGNWSGDSLIQLIFEIQDFKINSTHVITSDLVKKYTYDTILNQGTYAAHLVALAHLNDFAEEAALLAAEIGDIEPLEKLLENYNKLNIIRLSRNYDYFPVLGRKAKLEYIENKYEQANETFNTMFFKYGSSLFKFTSKLNPKVLCPERYEGFLPTALLEAAAYNKHVLALKKKGGEKLQLLSEADELYTYITSVRSSDLQLSILEEAANNKFRLYEIHKDISIKQHFLSQSDYLYTKLFQMRNYITSVQTKVHAALIRHKLASMQEEPQIRKQLLISTDQLFENTLPEIDRIFSLEDRNEILYVVADISYILAQQEDNFQAKQAYLAKAAENFRKIEQALEDDQSIEFSQRGRLSVYSKLVSKALLTLPLKIWKS